MYHSFITLSTNNNPGNDIMQQIIRKPCQEKASTKNPDAADNVVNVKATTLVKSVK